MDKKITIVNDSYYDGVPQWMLDMSLEEIEAAIEEIKKLENCEHIETMKEL